MRIIPVIDLLHGQVVRGIGGRRNEYRPIHSQLVLDARPESVAAAFVKQFSFHTAYVADLDAIIDGRCSTTEWKQIAAAGLKLWLDAGINNSLAARKIVASGKELNIDFELVIGLESLESPEELTAIQQLCDRRAIFSLDIRAGQPLTQIEKWKSLTPLEIAAQAISRGTNRLIILDLADVGESRGTRTLQLCRDLRNDHSHLELIAGGGVRNLDDLKALANAGASAALVASALHDGRLAPKDIQTISAPPP
ncbi:MAG TPA: HisA/HisF-related TIM barrel protein [Pirellulaceae bacterium]|jgi:phosphoribosylformimino-5-aminoimidazole carboxamide ribotide isomerase